MPALVRFSRQKDGRNWEIYDKDTGEVKGHSFTRQAAQASANARNAAEHGWEPTGKPARYKR